MAIMKSIFKHDHKEVKSKLNDIKAESFMIQDNLLQQELDRLKIPIQDEKANPLSTTRKDDLRHIHEAIKGMNSRDVDRLTNSLQKKLSD